MSSDYEVQLLGKLVSIDSRTGNSDGYKKVADIITNEIRKLGLEPEIYDGNEEAKDGIYRPNIVAHYDVGSDKTLGLLTHYDVVPPGPSWHTDPFKVEIKEMDGEKRIYGRGVADDKGCIVAVLGALREIIRRKLSPKWNITFMCVADEEIGGQYGAGYIARNKIVDLNALAVLDASSMGLVIGASGIVHGVIKVKGKQGHAGYIFGSENALHRAIVFLGELLNFVNSRSLKISKLKNPPEFPIPNVWGRFSLTWAKTSNTTYNVVPGDVEIGFDMRLIPEEDPKDAVTELKTFFEMTKYKTSIYDVELNIVRAYAGYFTDENHPFVRIAKEALYEATKRNLPIIGMLGGNDGGWFRDYNIPIISFGVWDKKSNIHGADESVSPKRILELKRFIINLTQKPLPP